MPRGGQYSIRYGCETQYWTPLFLAIEKGETDVIKLLLEYGANKEWTADIFSPQGKYNVSTEDIINKVTGWHSYKKELEIRELIYS